MVYYKENLFGVLIRGPLFIESKLMQAIEATLPGIKARPCLAGMHNRGQGGTNP